MDEDAIDFNPPSVGREAHLKKLETAWKSHAIFGIFGVRAVGKSRFVKEFLNRNCQRLRLKRDVNVIEVDLKLFDNTTGNLIHLVYSCLGLMPDIDAINKGKWKEHIANEVRKKLTDLQVLTLWFDNAEDVLDLDRQVHDQFLSLCVMLVQHCRGIKIIITSTTKILFTQIRKIYFQLELNPLAKSEVIRLMEKVAPDVEFGDFAGPIAELCDGLPQLVIKTGSELSEDDRMLNPEEMFELLLENKLRILSREYYPEEDRVADVYSKFLQRLPDVLQRQLAALNYIPGSFNAIEAKEFLGYDKVSTVKDQTLIPIRRRYVLNYDSQSGRFNIQGILRNCIDSYLKWADIPAVRQRYCKVFTKVMKEVCEEMGTVEYACALTRFSAEQPNFQKLLTEVMHCEEKTYCYFMEVADSCSLLLERFFSRESERFHKGCLDLTKKYGNTSDLAKVNIAFGSLYTNVRGEFCAGEIHYRQAMDVLKSLGDCQVMGLANQRMGWSLYRQGRYHESLRFLEASRKILKSRGLENSSLIVVNLSSLGVVNNAMGNFERAMNFHFKTLKLRRKTQSECHPAVGATYNNIGLLYNEMGSPEQALVYFQKGLEVKINSKAVLNSVMYSMNNVANQLCMRRKFDKAEAMLQDALHKLFTDATPSKGALSLTYDTFGKVYLAQMKYVEADNVLEKAVEIRQEIMPSGVAFAESLMHLAQAKFGLNHLGSARLCTNRVLELTIRYIEEMPHNTIILESLELLANIHSAQQNLDKRIEVLVKQRDELIRLLTFFETKKCVSKCEDMQTKLDVCLHQLNGLGYSFPNNNGDKVESNISGTVIREDILKENEIKQNILVQNMVEENDLNNQTKDPVQKYGQAYENENVDLNAKTLESNSKTSKQDYFDIFCKQWNYEQNRDNSPKTSVTKIIYTKESNHDIADETSSFCTVCGRNSFTNNTCTDIEHQSINKENGGVENCCENCCITTDGNESVFTISNTPDFKKLLEIEADQACVDRESFRFEGCCRNGLNKGSKETKLSCLCAQCLAITGACRHTS